ncbi:hypothetical protein BD410DRAFT_421295 [Rickenella mellea]|uniref:Uncharacterized protein n=1 Tax=Rickenella mellea TaxID=50990 RepID=A0A4Y7QIK3_9AGAM|nr:hypothetical protein BD410DRAFT_421295 [Rickenella mellea]
MAPNLYRLSNQVVQKRVEFNAEDAKVETYRGITEALVKLSPAVTASVAPTLATLVTRSGAHRSGLQADVKELEHLWEDVLDAFLNALLPHLDDHVDDAIRKIRDECERIISEGEMKHAKASESLIHESRRSPTLERQVTYRGQSEEIMRHDNNFRPAKRPRTMSDQPDRGMATEDAESHYANMRQSLRSLQSQIENQDKTVNRLIKENEELKISLDGLVRSSHRSPRTQYPLSPEQLEHLRQSLHIPSLTRMDDALDHQRNLNRTFDDQIHHLERNVLACADTLNIRLPHPMIHGHRN